MVAYVQYTLWSIEWYNSSSRHTQSQSEQLLDTDVGGTYTSYLCKENSHSDTVPRATRADRPTRIRNACSAVRMAGDDYFSQNIGDCLYSLQARKWKLFQTYNNRGWKQLWHQLLYVQRFTADFTAELTATSRRWIHPCISYFKRKRDRLQTT